MCSFTNVAASASWGPPISPIIITADRKSTRLNSSHLVISYAVFCLKKNSPERAESCDLSRPPRNHQRKFRYRLLQRVVQPRTRPSLQPLHTRRLRRVASLPADLVWPVALVYSAAA